MAESLADALIALRRVARLSQDALAEVAGVARGTVKGIEAGKLGQHPKTLALIADGLATDGTGLRDADKARLYYNRLMIAAGYCPSLIESMQVPPDLSLSLATLFPSEAVPALRIALQQIAALDADDQNFAITFVRDRLPSMLDWHNQSGRAGRLSQPDR